jgi:hypothetical protein
MKQAYTDHGAEAPVFADDTLELSLPKPVEPKIITDLTPKVIPPFPGTRIPS